MGLFDQVAICGRKDDLPLDLPAETVFSMLHGDFPLDSEEILRPGRLVCLEHSVNRESRPAQAVDGLCRVLRRGIDAARAEDGAFSRLFLCMTVSPDVTMDVFDRSVLIRLGSRSFCCGLPAGSAGFTRLMPASDFTIIPAVLPEVMPPAGFLLHPLQNDLRHSSAVLHREDHM